MARKLIASTIKSKAAVKGAPAKAAVKGAPFKAAPVRGRGTLRPFTAHEPMQRISLVREGVPADTVETLATTLGLPKERLLEGLGLAVSTVNRKLATGARLGPAESERVVALLQMVDTVERSLAGSDAAAEQFEVGRWLGTWLATPNAALGDERPLSLLDTADGRMLVGDLLASMESGAYW